MSPAVTPAEANPAEATAPIHGTLPRAAGPRWPVWLTAALLIPGLLVLGEGTNKTPHPTVPPAPATLRGIGGPLLVLPTDGFIDMWVMNWTTDRFPRLVNGASSFNPQEIIRAREVAKTFPDQASVAYLQKLGVRNVMVLAGYVRGTPYERALTAQPGGLPLRRTQLGDDVLFTIEPAG